MQLPIDPDDEAGFAAASAGLQNAFEQWLVARKIDAPDAVGNADTALQWKWGYGDGHLLRWTLPEIDELLLEWYPRKVVLPQDMIDDVPESLRLFLVHLAETGVLDRGSSSTPSIDRHLRQIVAPFRRAMADTSRHGMGKGLFAALEGIGGGPGSIDPDDPEMMRSLIDRFNGLPPHVRAQFGLGGMQPQPIDPWAGAMAGIELPPMPDIARTEMDRAASQTSVLRVFDAIASIFESPRRLTMAGNLTVADGWLLDGAVRKVLPLGDPDAVDRQVAETRPTALRSSADLRSVATWVPWARKAGVVRVAKGEMHTTASWKKTPPTARWARAVAALLDLGPMAVGNAAAWHIHELADLIDEGTEVLLGMLYAMDGRAIPYADLLAVVDGVAQEEVRWSPAMTAAMRSTAVTAAFERFVWTLTVAGIVEHCELDPDGETLLDVPTENSLPALRCPPTGAVLLAPHLREFGYEIPEVGLLANRPLAELMAGVADWHRTRIEREFLAWVAANGVERAVADMADVVDASIDPVTRHAAIDLMGMLPDAEANVRTFLRSKGRAQAARWLLERGLLRDEDADPDVMLLGALESLSFGCTGDPDDDEQLTPLLVTMAEAVGVDAVFATLWRITEPWAGDVLAAYGRLHADKRTSKAARKALMQHRTNVAQNRNR